MPDKQLSLTLSLSLSQMALSQVTTYPKNSRIPLAEKLIPKINDNCETPTNIAFVVHIALIWWGIFGSNFCVSEKRDRKWIEGFEIEFFRFC